jgi:hypothetical protein
MFWVGLLCFSKIVGNHLQATMAYRLSNIPAVPRRHSPQKTYTSVTIENDVEPMCERCQCRPIFKNFRSHLSTGVWRPVDIVEGTDVPTMLPHCTHQRIVCESTGDRTVTITCLSVSLSRQLSARHSPDIQRLSLIRDHYSSDTGRVSADYRPISVKHRLITHRSYIISHRSDLGRVLADVSWDIGRLWTDVCSMSKMWPLLGGRSVPGIGRFMDVNDVGDRRRHR